MVETEMLSKKLGVVTEEYKKKKIYIYIILL